MINVGRKGAFETDVVLAKDECRSGREEEDGNGYYGITSAPSNL